MIKARGFFVKLVNMKSTYTNIHRHACSVEDEKNTLLETHSSFKPKLFAKMKKRTMLYAISLFVSPVYKHTRTHTQV